MYLYGKNIYKWEKTFDYQRGNPQTGFCFERMVKKRCCGLQEFHGIPRSAMKCWGQISGGSTSHIYPEIRLW